MKKIGEIQINLAAQTEPELCSKRITLITNQLTEMAAICILRGQFKSGEEGMIIKDLMRDIRQFDLTAVSAAIKIHKQQSPFLPAISDLNKILKPLREYEAARERKDYIIMTQIREAAEVIGNNIINEKAAITDKTLALGLQEKHKELAE